MNIILIAIDTCRADHLGCCGYARDTSPALDALAADGVLFEQLLAPAVPTQPSYTTAYTGQYSITHGIVSQGGAADLSPQAPFLPELLQRAGFTTCAVDTMYHMKPWFARGYEFYIAPGARLQHRQEVPCDEVNARAIPWLRQHADEQFFLFVHYWDPHTPYLPPARYRTFYDGDPTDPAHPDTLAALRTQPFGEWWADRWFNQLPQPLRDADYLVGLYDGEIRYATDGVAQLLDALAHTRAADDTLVMVFADHGENMYRHGIFFDHHGLYDGNLHVPLIVRWPGRAPAGRRVPHLVQHVDLAPTLLEAAGVPVPAVMEGATLLPLLTGAGDAAVHDRLVTQECSWQAKWALRTNEYKFILSREHDRPDIHGMPPRELYHLPSDPGELTNLAAERADIVAQMECELEQWIAAMMAKNGLERDPLIAQGITLGHNWREWVERKGYW